METDGILKKAKEDIQKELSIPVPVVGREKWREERLEAVKSILAQMENDLVSAKGSQKRKILSYGKALYKQTKKEIYKTSAPKTQTLRLPKKRREPIRNGGGQSKSAIGQTTPKRRSARYLEIPKESDPLPIESDPLVLKAESSIQCRLVRFLVPTACISNSDERKG